MQNICNNNVYHIILKLFVVLFNNIYLFVINLICISESNIHIILLLPI